MEYIHSAKLRMKCKPAEYQATTCNVMWADFSEIVTYQIEKAP